MKFHCIAGYLCICMNLSVAADWSTPVPISAGGSAINATGSPLVIDANSNAFVGWLDGLPTVAQTLSSADLPFGAAAWTTPKLIFSNPLSPPSFPSFPILVLNNNSSKQLAVWVIQDFTAPFSIFEASRRNSSNGAWQPPISIFFPSLPALGGEAGSNTGNLSTFVALTPVAFTPPFDITLFTLLNNSDAWTTPVELAVDNSTAPALDGAAAGDKSLVVWKVNMPMLELQGLRSVFSTGDSTPTSNIPLPPGSTDVASVLLALNEKGDAVAFFVVTIGGGSTLYTSTLLGGKDIWSDPILISNPANQVAGASVAIDAFGTATLLWAEQVMLGQEFVRAATLPLGGIPAQVTDLTDGTVPGATVGAASLRVTMDSFGDAAAIWLLQTGGENRVQVSALAKGAGQSWAAPLTLSTTGRTPPRIVLSDQQTAVAVWTDDVTGILMGSSFTYLFPLNPPSDFVGEVISNRFLNHTEYALYMNWVPSPASNITAYEIRKNGKLLATIPREGPFNFLENLSSKHVKGTYTLTAKASNGNQSVPLTLVISK